MSQFNRRSLLRGAGAGAAVLTLPLARPDVVRSQMEVPKRFVIFYASQGNFPGQWEPRPVAGRSEPTRDEWELGPTMRMLQPYKERLTLFENLDMLSRYLDPLQASNAHTDGQTHALAATNRFSDQLAGGPTIDWVIADHINRNGSPTRLPFLGISSGQNGAPDGPTYTGPGEKASVVRAPSDLYNVLFPGPVSNDAEAALRRSRMFEFLRGEHETFRQKLPKAARPKLQSHWDKRFNLENSLNFSNGREAYRLSPDILDLYDQFVDKYKVSPENTAIQWANKAEMNIKMAASALHTDTTRVITFTLDNPDPYSMGLNPDAVGHTSPHLFVHAYLQEGNETRNRPTAFETMMRWNSLLGEKFKTLLDELDARTEPDGSSLLDNTLLLWSAHIPAGNHGKHELPWVVVGGDRFGLQGGQYIRFPTRTDSSIRRGGQIGRAHNDLLTSLAIAMDVPISNFGTREVAGGPIEEMFT